MLVIVGLIIGGVLVGRVLIRQSELRSVSSDVENYKMAVMLFKNKYNGLPGDMTNATTFFGAMVNNGNGDRIFVPASGASLPGEVFGAWQQLALAGLIMGEFSGLAGPAAGYDSLIGYNVPASRVTGGGFTWYPHGTMFGFASYYDGVYGQSIYFGTDTVGGHTSGTILTPIEAHIIDKKIDDGIPATGAVRTFYSGTAAPNCNTGANNAGINSTYNLTYSGVSCTLVFLPGF